MAPMIFGRGLVVFVVATALGFMSAARAQDKPADGSSSQPTSVPAESMKKLENLKRQLADDQAKRAAAGEPAPPTPPPPPQDDNNAAKLEELRRRASASTQSANETPPAPVVDEEFEGPPSYSSPRALSRRTTYQTQPSNVTPPATARRTEAHTPTSAPDGRTYFFNFDGAPWEEVVRFFARQIGKPLINEKDIVIGGELTYLNPNTKFTKDEAVDELNMIMQEKGVRFVEREHYLEVLPVSELYMHLDLAHIFPTIEKFNQANPRDMDYVTVYIDVQPGQTAQKLADIFGKSLPDYVRGPEVVPGTNRLQLTALARDVRKFLALTERIEIKPTDPRETKVFNIKTSATDVDRMIRDIMSFGGATPGAVGQPFIRDQKTGQMIPNPQRSPTAMDDDVRITADARTNTLIVKATHDKMTEIEKVIEMIDIPLDLVFTTKVTPITNANPTEIANLLNQVFQQEQGQGTPGWQRLQQMRNQPGRPGQPQPPQPQPQPNMAFNPNDPSSFTWESAIERAKKTIRIVPDERTRGIIVYANADGHQRVAEMLQTLDVPQPSNYQKFTLEKANAADIYDTVSQIAQNMRNRTAQGGRAATVLLDEPSNAFYVIAEREDMENISDIIKQLDVSSNENPRHIVTLKNLLPSTVAQTIAPLLNTGAAGGAAPMPGARGRNRGMGPQPAMKSGPSATQRAQIIPLDEAQTLIVVCSDTDWAKVEDTIKLWDDSSVSNTPIVQSFELANGDAQAVASTVGRLYSNYTHPALGRQPVSVTADGNTVYVTAIKPAVDEIARLISQLDVADRARTEILELTTADATQVAQQAQTLFGNGRSTGGPRGGNFGGSSAAGVSIQPDAATNSLIVRADEHTLDLIRDFALESDQRAAGQKLERRIFTPQNVQVQDLANALTGAFGGSGGGGGRFGNPGGSGGSRVKVISAGQQLIVEAPASKMNEVATLVDQVDRPGDINKLVIETRKYPGVNVAALAQQLTAAYGKRPRTDRLQVSFTGDPALETLMIIAPKDEMAGIDKLLTQMTEEGVNFALETVNFDLAHATAADIADSVKQQLTARLSRYGQDSARNINVVADPRGNRLIVTVPKVGLEFAAQAIKDFDRDIPGETAVPQTVELKNADGDTVAETLRKLFPARNGRGRPSPDDLTVEASGKSLFLKGPKAKVTQAKEMIDEIDKAPDVMVKVYQLKVLSATVASAGVTAFLAKQGKAGQQSGAYPEPTTNSLVVVAPKASIPLIDALIREIEEVEVPTPITRAYPLKNADTEIVRAAVDKLLQAVAAEKSGKGPAAGGAVSGDPTTSRVIVVAPKDVQERVADLIAKFDDESSQQIVDIIPLDTADATQVAKAISDMLTQRKDSPGAGSVRVSAEASTNKLLVAGLPKAVQDIHRWIDELQAGDSNQPQVKSFRLRYAATTDVKDQVEAAFPKGKTAADTVVVTEDEFNDRLIIAASARKIRQIATFIEQLDVAVPDEDGLGKQFYIVDVNRGKASDVEFELMDVLPSAEHNGPQIDSDWSDTYLKVRCRPAELDNIVKLVRQIESRLPVSRTTVVKNIHGLDPRVVIRQLQDNGANVEVIGAVEPPKPKGLEEYLREENDKPPTSPKRRETGARVRAGDTSGAFAQPIQRGMLATSAILDDIDRELSGAPAARPVFRLASAIVAQDESQTQPARTPPPRAPQPAPREAAPRTTVQPPAGESTLRTQPPASTVEPTAPLSTPARSTPPDTGVAKTSDTAAGTAAAPAQTPSGREKVVVKIDPDGRVLMVGPEGDVKDLEEAIDKFIDTQSAGEVIKIFKFRYGDVNAAAQIIDKMFNERQIIRLPQQQQPGQPQPGQQQQQQGGKGQDGKEGGGGLDALRNLAGGGNQAGGRNNRNNRNQQNQNMGGAQIAGNQRIRMATDPGHDRLIIKCDEADLPEIRQLLRELDIPPGEVELKVIQLKNLTARETSDNIKEVLGINRARGGANNRQQNPFGGQPGGNQQQQLMQMLQQQMVTLPGAAEGEAARIDSAEIVPNEITNSLLVSAPPEVMNIILDVVTQLEELEGRDIVGIYNIPLKSAKVEDIAPMLQEIYGGGRRGGGEGGGPGRSANPGQMGPITITGDPRTNTLIIAAQKKDIDKVTDQIARLDVVKPPAEAETYVCKYGSAADIARIVQEIYGASGGNTGGGFNFPSPDGGDRRAARSVTETIRITADDATNSILVFASERKREEIFKKIKEQDDLNKSQYREINVVFANPEDLAEKLNQLFGTGGGGNSGMQFFPGNFGGGNFNFRGGRNRSSTPGGRAVIIGDKGSRKLLVKAPNELFEQIEDMVALLDKPDKQLEVRQFPLNFASASQVVDSLKTGMTEYMQVLHLTDPNAKGLEAFTAVPDDRTNQIVVVGSEKIFAFVGQLIEMVDKPPQGGIETVKVTNASASEIVSLVSQFMPQPAEAAASGRGANGRPAAAGVINAPQMVPNDSNNTIVLRGSEAQVDEIKRMIAVFDQPGMAGLATNIKVIQLPLGQDAPALAQEVERMINATLQNQAQTTGRQPRQVTIGANEYTNSLMVAGDPTIFGMVQGLVNDIVGIRPQAPITAILDLKHLSPEDVQQLVEDLRSNGRPGAGGTRVRRTGGAPGNGGSPVIRPSGGGGGAGAPSPSGSSIGNQIRNRTRSSPPSNNPPRRNPQPPGGNPGGMRSSDTIVLVPALLTMLLSQPLSAAQPDMQQPAPTTVVQAHLREFFGSFARDPLIRAVATVLSREDDVADAAVGETPAAIVRNPSDQPSRASEGAKNGPVEEDLPALNRPATQSRERSAAHRRVPELAAAPQTPPQPARPPRSTTRPAHPRRPDVEEEDVPARVPSNPPSTPPARPAAPPPAANRPAQPPVNPNATTPPPSNAATPNAQPSQPNAGNEENAAVVGQVPGQLRGNVNAVPLGNDRVIIQGDPSDIAFLQQLINQMEANTPGSEIQVIHLPDQIKAANIQPLVEQILEAEIEIRSPNGRVAPSDRFIIIAEPRSNSLIVSASERNVDRINDLVKQLEEGEITPSGSQMVPLVNISAIEAVNQLQPVLDRFNTLRQVPQEAQPSIEPIERANSILIIGSPSDIAEITDLIKAVDVPVPTGAEPTDFTSSQLIMIQLKNALSDDVVKSMNDLITLNGSTGATGGSTGGANQPANRARGAAARAEARILRLRLDDGTELPPLDLEKPIRLISDKGTNSVIIASTPKNNESLQQITKVFDTLPAGEETDVRAITLKSASAETVAKLIEDTFKNAKASLQRPANLAGTNFEKGVLPPIPPGLAASGLPYNIGVTFEARSNTIVVVGRHDAVLLATGLIAEMDRSSVQLGGKPHVLALKNIAASKMSDNLGKVLKDRATAMGGDKNAARDSAVIVPDDRSNALVIIATDEVYDMLSDLATHLDTAASYSPVDTRYRQLKFADAAKLQSMLQQLFDKKKDARKAAIKDATEQTVSILADPRSNSLVMTGTRDFMDEAEHLIDTLDKPFEPTVAFEIINVRLNSAASIASLLQDMVDKALGTGRAGTGGGGGGGDSRLSGSPIQIAADPSSNSLVVAASREDMERIKRWVEILDVKPIINRMVSIVPVARGSAEDAAKLASDMFKGSTTGGPGGGTGSAVKGANPAADVTITPDKTTNSVVIVGPPPVVADIAAIVKQIVEAPIGPISLYANFPLQQADAETAADLLNSILTGQSTTVGGSSTGGSRTNTGGNRTSGSSGTSGSNPRAMNLLWQHEKDGQIETLQADAANVNIIADARTNSLVITAPPKTMSLLRELIKDIDVPPNAANIRFFALRNADAEQTVQLLEQVFHGATGGTSGTNRGGSTNRAGSITSTPEGERTLTFGEALTAEGGRQEINFSADTRTNAVIAAGTKGYLDLVQQIIFELDTKPMEEIKTLVYEPKNSKPEELETTIKSWSDAEKARIGELGDTVSAQRKIESEIVAVASKDAKRLVVAYNPRREAEVLNVLQQLDQAPPQVMIQVLIIEVSMDNALDLGVEFAFQDLQFAKAGPNDTNTFDYVGGTDVGAAGSGLAGFAFTATGADFNFLIRTLQNEGSLNVLSRPQIVAMDNQKATIDVSNDVPYVSSISQSTVGGAVTTQVQREQIGIKLEVTPQINPDGFVRMDINQEVSDFTGSTVDVGQGVTAPVFFRRVATTTVSVKDNETVILGGLITAREEKREQKVPLVGDIPFLGMLFRNQSDNTKRTELLIVLTPRVIRGVDDYNEISTQERDRMELLPPEWLSGPLMENMRIAPGDLHLKDEKGNPIIPPLEPQPGEAITPHERREGAPDDYGIVRPVSGAVPAPSSGGEDDSYAPPVPARVRGGGG